MPFSYDALQRRLVGLPMVRIVPFFALGILLQYYLVLNPWWLLALFVLCGLGAVWRASTACRMLFLVVAGYLVADLQPRLKSIPTDRALEIELQLIKDLLCAGAHNLAVDQTELGRERAQTDIFGDSHLADQIEFLMHNTDTFFLCILRPMDLHFLAK